MSKGNNPRTRRAWSKERRDLLLEMVDNGKTDAELALHFGVSPAAVGKIRRELRGPKPPDSPPWSEEESAELMRRWNAGEHAEAIAAALNRTVWAVRCKFYGMRGPVVRREPPSYLNRINFRPAKPDPADQALALARQLRHETITAAIFGDPLPGRSALDEKRAAGLLR